MARVRKSQDQSGQALLEYMISLFLVVAFVGILAVSFKNTVWTLWKQFGKEISAACPSCPPPDDRLR